MLSFCSLCKHFSLSLPFLLCFLFTNLLTLSLFICPSSSSSVSSSLHPCPISPVMFNSYHFMYFMYLPFSPISFFVLFFFFLYSCFLLVFHIFFISPSSLSSSLAISLLQSCSIRSDFPSTLFNLSGCLMKSLLKWTIVALRIFIERNNQPCFVCVCARACMLPPLPPFKEIISWRQDCESSELWAEQQTDRHRSAEPWVNNSGIMGTAAASVYFIMTNMVIAQLMQLRTVQHRGWQIKMWVMHRHHPRSAWTERILLFFVEICCYTV